MTFSVIIPARYASTRLPGKPLQLLGEKPLVQWVYEAAMASSAERVIVATDDERIVQAVQNFNGEWCLTSADHQSGTDRLHEVAQQQNFAKDHIVVNVQGDEPLIPPSVIDQVARNLEQRPELGMATLCEPLTLQEDFLNPNIVKVVADQQGYALYFSRAPIPWDRDQTAQSASYAPAKRHLGLYAYRVGLLNQFVAWPQAELENIEKLEQLRVLANGHRIHIEEAIAQVPGGVDTEEDLDKVRALIQTMGEQQ